MKPRTGLLKRAHRDSSSNRESVDRVRSSLKSSMHLHMPLKDLNSERSKLKQQRADSRKKYFKQECFDRVKDHIISKSSTQRFSEFKHSMRPSTEEIKRPRASDTRSFSGHVKSSTSALQRKYIDALNKAHGRRNSKSGRMSACNSIQGL
jgi:hypothetical protein